MCNKLHKDSIAIPPTGMAWKVFMTTVEDEHELQTLCYEHRYKSVDGVTITWQVDYGRDSPRGFCCFPAYPIQFLKKVYTRSIQNLRSRLTAIPVLYEEGLGSHYENNVIKGVYKILLARKLTLHPRYAAKGYHF